MEAKSQGISTRTIHEIYILGILLAVIVGLASIQWYQIDKLVELVGFSATVSSLLLAVMAIGYSIYSGTGIERGVSSLLTAVQSVRSSAADVQSLREALTQELRSLGEATGRIKSEIALQSGAIQKLAEQKEQAAEVEVSAGRGAAPKDATTNQEEEMERLVRRTSITGALSLLVAARCSEQGRPIDYVAALRDTFGDPDYVHGFLVAVSSIGVVDIEFGNQMLQKVSQPFPMSASKIKVRLIEKLERWKSMSVEDKARYQKVILEIDERLAQGPKGESKEAASAQA